MVPETKEIRTKNQTGKQSHSDCYHHRLFLKSHRFHETDLIRKDIAEKAKYQRIQQSLKRGDQIIQALIVPDLIENLTLNVICKFRPGIEPCKTASYDCDGNKRQNEQQRFFVFL